MTKQDFRNRVKGLFSVRWLKNNGEEGYIHRGILGLNKRIDGEHKEHDNYVLVYKVGNGYGDVRRWANVNPNKMNLIALAIYISIIWCVIFYLGINLFTIWLINFGFMFYLSY